MRKKKISRSRLALLMMVLPFVLLVLVFYYVPLFGWTYAFYDYKPGIPLADSHFAGLKYFRLLFEYKDDLFRVLNNTLALGFLVILTSPLAVLFAIMMNEVKNRRFKGLVQTLTTLPNFISWVIVYSVMTILFASDGLLNAALTQLHWIENPTNVLGYKPGTWWVQTAIYVWKYLGWNSIIYLAAIAGIDPELYEAAKVDGANRFQRMMTITIPGVLPTFFVLLLLQLANILSVNFEQTLVFYNSLVADKIETIDYYVYRIGLKTGDISFGTAVGMAKSLVSILLLFLVNGLSKKARGESVF